MHCLESIQLLLHACSIPKFEDLVPLGRQNLSLFIPIISFIRSTYTDNICLEQTAASTIAQELGYLPLALSQAGAYIHISRYSLSWYLEEYRTEAAYLLSQRWTTRQDDKSVFAT